MELLVQTVGNSILGMIIVFLVLIILMGCISVMSACMKKPITEKAAAPAAAPAAEKVALAKGSCGEVKLFDVPDKTAAMLMAITADKLGEPLNTLRFVSIKEVK